MSGSEQWFFVLDGEHAGPIDSQTLEGMIRSKHLPSDVLVCREGMQNWLSANEVGLINEPHSSQKNQPPAEVDLAFDSQPNHSNLSSESSSTLARNEIYQKITFGLIALLIVILSIGGGLFAVQSKNHKKEVSSLEKSQSKSKELAGKLASDSERLQHNFDQLNESKLSLEKSESGQTQTISDLNTTNSQLSAQNQTLLENLREATNKLHTLKNDGGGTDDRIRAANQRVASAESAALDAKQQLEQTIRQAQSQAAQLQKQINEKTSNTQEQLSAKESAIQSLSNELATLKTQLFEATNQVAGLKRELGESPIRIGSPSGPKPLVDTKPFSEIKYTDTEYNFAIISKGLSDGVKNGESFRIVSKESGEVIGELKIYKVQDDVSLGNLGIININSLKAGDLVYRK
jgi:hypothetical protein